ncbi:cyclic AMP-dependent transcription factor ATF-1-like isoform X2 [Dysidea avara]|uniref:cyclic AMP-dependent transcription factor ATF-1-like isoform X2 n=1 Tax=Dysidea avara TaxID=196820 RepID=UPI003323E78E
MFEILGRMEAKPASDMSSTSASGDKGDEGFSIPSSIRAANETAAKVEVEKSGSLLTARIPAVPTTSTQQPVDITEEPNPLELSKEALARRPSFRRIYNDLASTDSDLKQFQQHANALTQIQLAAAQAQLQQQAEATPPSSQPMDTQQILQQTLQLQSMLLNAGINPAQAIALSQNQLTAGQHLQVPAAQLLTNAVLTSSPNLSGSSTTQVASPLSDSELQSPMTSRSVGTKLTCSPATPMTPEELADEAHKKRDVRLRKNREAAKECRRKKKEYVRCLENRVSVLESQNQALIGELRALKELYLPKQDSS